MVPRAAMAMLLNGVDGSGMRERAAWKWQGKA